MLDSLLPCEIKLVTYVVVKVSCTINQAPPPLYGAQRLHRPRENGQIRWIHSELIARSLAHPWITIVLRPNYEYHRIYQSPGWWLSIANPVSSLSHVSSHPSVARYSKYLNGLPNWSTESVEAKSVKEKAAKTIAQLVDSRIETERERGRALFYGYTLTTKQKKQVKFVQCRFRLTGEKRLRPLPLSLRRSDED